MNSILDFFEKYARKFFPHLFGHNKWNEFVTSCKETLTMMLVVGAVSFVIGTIIGIILVVTKKGGIMQNTLIYQFFDKVINVFRSIPFVILVMWLIPFTRIIMGKAIGLQGALVPLVVGTTPFFARQIESALSEVDNGLIEAAKSMGEGPFGIIWRVYLKESLPGIVRGTTITLINLLGLTALAGVVGGGGIGDYALRYGYMRAEKDITLFTVIVLLLMVSIIQIAGNFICRKLQR